MRAKKRLRRGYSSIRALIDWYADLQLIRWL
jgi:hypothetical protein